MERTLCKSNRIHSLGIWFGVRNTFPGTRVWRSGAPQMSLALRGCRRWHWRCARLHFCSCFDPTTTPTGTDDHLQQCPTFADATPSGSPPSWVCSCCWYGGTAGVAESDDTPPAVDGPRPSPKNIKKTIHYSPTAITTTNCRIPSKKGMHGTKAATSSDNRASGLSSRDFQGP